MSVVLTATPDQLPRDGSSQSVITVTVRDVTGRPVSGQRLGIATSVGAVSQDQVVTDEAGRASFAFVAPSASTVGSSATISAVPIDTNGANAAPRVVRILLTGVANSTAPTASFTFAPSAPTVRDSVTFDASATTDEGVRCNDVCTYSWDFGGEATATGRIVTYAFQNARTYPVTLTVTDGAGAAGTTTQNVAVNLGTAPTASFTFSPSSPGIFEPISFTAEASRPGQAGRTLVNYAWQFGDGTNASGLRVTKSYNTTGTYTVTLTVTDSAGAQATTTQAVTVVVGVTADFNYSNPTDGSLTVYFNAEISLGSSTGFGTRNPITKYIWNFGDGTSVEETTSPRIAHTFGAATTYRVTLTVEDSAGRRATDTETVAVAN